MKRTSKILYSLAFLGLLIMYIILNLYKGVAVSGGDPFSFHNIAKMSLIFIVGIPAGLFIKRILSEENDDRSKK